MINGAFSCCWEGGPFIINFVMSPMCLFDVQQHDWLLMQVHFAHYVQRAMGQADLIVEG